MILKPKKIESVEPVQQPKPKKYIKPDPVQIDTVPISVEDPLPDLLELNKSVKECIQLLDQNIVDVTQGWGEFTNIEDVKKALNDLFIRLNTSPHTYTKHDYLLLLQLLSKTLLHLYQVDSELAPIAYTGDVEDLVQSEPFILNCGTSTENV